MNRWIRMSAVTACVASALACDEQTEVQRQTRDLEQAQKNVAQVTEQLESQLAEAKADVVRLEQKVALARQGLTDDVLENQKELQAALKAQESKVETELGEAKREAQIHNRDSEAALKQLGQSAPASRDVPPPVSPAQPAEPGAAPDDGPGRNEFVPVKGGPDTQPEGRPETEPGMPPVEVTPDAPPAPASPPHVDPSPVNTPPVTPPADAPPADAPPSASPPSAAPPPHQPPPNEPPPAPAPPAL
jgi:TolA-binding protein